LLASRLSPFTSIDKALGIHSMEAWKNPRFEIGASENIKIPSCNRNFKQPFNT
jgi:hypothetical protein